MTFYFGGQRPPQLVVAEGNNIFEVTETHIRGRRPSYFLVAGGHKSFYVTCPGQNRDYGHYTDDILFRKYLLHKYSLLYRMLIKYVHIVQSVFNVSHYPNCNTMKNHRCIYQIALIYDL